MNKRNYQKELDQIIKQQADRDTVPRLLLHSCCAPCSSYILEYLSEFFEITIYFYNPNIYPQTEFLKRLAEEESLAARMDFVHPVRVMGGAWESDVFYRVSRNYEEEPEGGERCFRCYGLRLRETAKVAQAGGYDYFTTTLSISPLKNAEKLNEIGEALEKEFGIAWLPSDFKKKEGYKRSVELSKQYGLYRQDYCGCIYSMNREKIVKAADSLT